MTRVYGRWECPVCRRTMSSNGLARTNHCRKHVREGKMVEVKETYTFFPYEGLRFDVVRTPKGTG